MPGIDDPLRDLDVAEIYEPATYAELAMYECLGFCEKGGGGRFIDAGAPELDGALPVNPSGGVLSANPVGATALIRVAEAALQVMGEAGEHQIDGVRTALATGYGGNAWTDLLSCGESREAVTDEPLRLRAAGHARYRFAAGAYASRFFSTLKDEQRFLARRCPNGHVLLPPRPVCGLVQCPDRDWVEVGPRATLGGYTVVYVPFTDPMTGVGAPGAVRLRPDPLRRLRHQRLPPARRDRAAKARASGCPSSPFWRDSRSAPGRFADILHFRPLYEEDA